MTYLGISCRFHLLFDFLHAISHLLNCEIEEWNGKQQNRTKLNRIRCMLHVQFFLMYWKQPGVHEYSMTPCVAQEIQVTVRSISDTSHNGQWRYTKKTWCSCPTPPLGQICMSDPSLRSFVVGFTRSMHPFRSQWISWIRFNFSCRIHIKQRNMIIFLGAKLFLTTNRQTRSSKGQVKEESQRRSGSWKWENPLEQSEICW